MRKGAKFSSPTPFRVHVHAGIIYGPIGCFVGFDFLKQLHNSLCMALVDMDVPQAVERSSYLPG